MIWIDTFLWSIFTYVCGWIGLLSILTYLASISIQQTALRVPQDLQKKHKAQWGLVTGSSSGIGKAIAEKLATQGINVVLVALDDALLAGTFEELKKKYPNVEFRKVGVNLAAKDYAYMGPITDATKDIRVNLLFNNAGYISTGLFADTDLERLRCNVECRSWYLFRREQLAPVGAGCDLDARLILCCFLKRADDAHLRQAFEHYCFTSGANSPIRVGDAFSSLPMRHHAQRTGHGFIGCLHPSTPRGRSRTPRRKSAIWTAHAAPTNPAHYLRTRSQDGRWSEPPVPTRGLSLH